VRRAWLICFAVAVLTGAPPARADDAAGALGFTLFSFGQLVPGEIGIDRTFDHPSESRLLVGWVFQIPFGIFSLGDADRAWTDGSTPLMRHRIVVAIVLANAREPDPPTGRQWRSTIEFRAGYRYRFRHRTAIAPYLGFGSNLSERQWSASPELGLHFGRDRVARPGLQLGLQGDVYPAGAPTRLMAVAAWTVW